MKNRDTQSIHIFFKSMIRLVPAMTLTAIACSDFVEVDTPKTELVREEVFADDGTAEAAMVGVYMYAVNSADHFANGWYVNDVAYIAGKSADEIGPDTGNEGIQLFENELETTNTRTMGIWTGAYHAIYRINAVIEGVKSSAGVSQTMARQLEGEAKFMRAFNYFYLVNLFGEVPLITSTDYRVNAVAPRAPVETVYALIMQDLKDAQGLLPADYSVWKQERIRPVKAAATALLARVYLYTGQWSEAESEASEVIGQTGLYAMTALTDIFLKNSKEAIWQFYPPQPNINSQHGYVAENAAYAVPLTDSLLNAFEANDNRYAAWVGSWPAYSYAYKYKVGWGTTWLENTTNLRLAELYLIRAEARLEQDDITGAQQDINVIRSRAGLSDTDAETEEEVHAAIRQERRIELFAEYGHRWLDLKRWGLASEVLAPVKPAWQATDVLYPVPESERLINRKLTQNEGYPGQ